MAAYRWPAGGLLLCCMLAAGGVGTAHARALHVVPAEETVLAAVLLTAMGGKEPVLLFDPRDRAAFDGYRTTWKGPVRCLYGSKTPATVAEQMRTAAGESCTLVNDAGLFARTLWPAARVAIAANATDYPWLLQAAAFAGATGSALVPVEDERTLAGWSLDVLYLTPPTARWAPTARAAVPTVIDLETPDALADEMIRKLGGSADVIVVTNAADREGLFSPSSLSLLAPLVSATHHAPLVVTSSPLPDLVEGQVRAFVAQHGLRPSYVILVGDELALRSHRIPDPVRAAGGPEARGGGTEVRVELFSEIQHKQPQDFAVGRIVAESLTQGSAVVARQHHGRRRGRSRPVIFLTNADGIFTLGETISRTTAEELRNVGIPVKAYYGNEINSERIQRALKETDLLVWEGHARDLTLEERGGIATTVAPEIVILQGCYTLDRSDPFILMERGTLAVLATSTAVYSAPGSALARAFFDAILYDGADLGTATRNARNFVLALARLQRDRGHQDWRKTYRAALAFALWGDPTLRPSLRPTQPMVPPAKWTRVDGDLSLTIPAKTLRQVSVGWYRARPVPRAMLGGLLLPDRDRDLRRLKELYFSVQQAGEGFATVCPPGEGWEVVSMHAPVTGTVSVLARPDWKMIGQEDASGTYTFPLANAVDACPGPREEAP